VENAYHKNRKAFVSAQKQTFQQRQDENSFRGKGKKPLGEKEKRHFDRSRGRPTRGEKKAQPYQCLREEGKTALGGGKRRYISLDRNEGVPGQIVLYHSEGKEYFSRMVRQYSA